MFQLCITDLKYLLTIPDLIFYVPISSLIWWESSYYPELRTFSFTFRFPSTLWIIFFFNPYSYLTFLKIQMLWPVSPIKTEGTKFFWNIVCNIHEFFSFNFSPDSSFLFSSRFLSLHVCFHVFYRVKLNLSLGR